jgi:hypothetical protein
LAMLDEESREVAILDELWTRWPVADLVELV